MNPSKQGHLNKRHAIWPYIVLMRLNKPVGFWLLLWPMIWALWIAGAGHPPIAIVAWMTLGCFLMRAAGCVFNDWADRHWDGAVSRTQNRPLPQGQVTANAALMLCAALLCLAFAVVCQLNLLTLKLSFVALGLTLLYPLTKRFFKAPQLFLGLAFSMAVLMAFSSVKNTLPPEAWLLYLAACLWPLAYDTLYAMVDREDDEHLPIYSLAQTLGRHDLTVISLLYAVFWLLLTGLGYHLQVNVAFYGIMLLAGLCLIAQLLYARDRHPKHCFQAFCSNQWLGALIATAWIIGLA